MIEIVIIDGQERFLESINILLSTQPDFEITGLGRDGFEAIKLVDTLKPDIALLDISLGYIDGANVTAILKARSPATAVIILTTLDDDEHVRKAISNGASGYLLKGLDMDKLAEEIRAVRNGGSVMTPVIASKTIRMFSELVKGKNIPQGPGRIQDPKLPNISRMEFRIASYIGQGLSNKEIAERLHLQTGTVRNYISAILQKTGLRDRTQVAIYAIRHGLISQPRRARV